MILKNYRYLHSFLRIVDIYFFMRKHRSLLMKSSACSALGSIKTVLAKKTFPFMEGRKTQPVFSNKSL